MKQKIFFLLLFCQPLCGYTFQFTSHKNGNLVLLPSFLQDMRQTFSRSIFVETGTYCGLSTQAAAAIFPHVHSVELSDTLYKEVSTKLSCIPNISLYHNNSADFLRSFCSQLQSQSEAMIFWLDAHESGGTTTHYKDILNPIVDELQALALHDMRNAIILIDDIRCFGSIYNTVVLSSSEGHPTVQELCALLHTINPDYRCIVSGDILVAYDEKQYDISVSPVAAACTFSRLYDGNDFSEDILEQEARIAEAYGDEREMICQLYQRTLEYKEISDFHSALWYGLLIAKTDPSAAHTAFSTVLETGYTHWRIYWYLAQTAHASHNNEQALLWLQQVLTSNSQYIPAITLTQKIVSECASGI